MPRAGAGTAAEPGPWEESQAVSESPGRGPSPPQPRPEHPFSGRPRRARPPGSGCEPASPSVPSSPSPRFPGRGRRAGTGGMGARAVALRARPGRAAGVWEASGGSRPPAASRAFPVTAGTRCLSGAFSLDLV